MLFGDWVVEAFMVANCWLNEPTAGFWTGDCCWIFGWTEFVLKSNCIELKSPMFISEDCWTGGWDMTSGCWGCCWTIGFCCCKKFIYWPKPCCWPIKFCVPNCWALTLNGVPNPWDEIPCVAKYWEFNVMFDEGCCWTEFFVL